MPRELRGFGVCPPLESYVHWQREMCIGRSEERDMSPLCIIHYLAIRTSGMISMYNQLMVVRIVSFIIPTYYKPTFLEHVICQGM